MLSTISTEQARALLEKVLGTWRTDELPKTEADRLWMELSELEPRESGNSLHIIENIYD
jgi:hypothetical protein